MKEKELFNALLKREKLGSTCIGSGVALPHCRLASCVNPVAAFIKLHTPIDFDTPDQQLVDLFLFFIAPIDNEEISLDILRDMYLRLKESEIQKRLRSYTDSKKIYDLLMLEFAL